MRSITLAGSPKLVMTNPSLTLKRKQVKKNKNLVFLNS